MLVQKTLKLVLLAILILGNSTKAQEWTVIKPSCFNGRCFNQRPAVRSVALPRQQRPAAGIFATRSRIEDITKCGYATGIHYKNNYYIVSCAHIWGGTGYRHFIVFNGAEVEVEILDVAQLDDLAILKPIPGMPCMPLNLETPLQGSAVRLGYRPGIHLGYRGGVEIIVKGYIKNGDSGGPIFNEKGLVGIIASYEYSMGSDPMGGQTTGPCATRIANFIHSLSESPPPAPVPPAPPAPPAPPRNLEPILAQLEEGGNALAVKVQSLVGPIETNSEDIAAMRIRLSALEQQVKDNALDSQRIAGVVEVLNREVIVVSDLTNRLNQARKDSELRIQRIEHSVTLLRTSTQENFSGRLNFRLRVDQSGRVIGVDSQ